MPVGTKATVKSLHPDELRAVGVADHPRQHLPPPLPARRRDHRRARRPARVLRLGRADPDRLGRLPGLLAPRHAARRRRRRRHVPLRLRRRGRAASRPRSRPDPAQPRLRHRDVPSTSARPQTSRAPSSRRRFGGRRTGPSGSGTPPRAEASSGSGSRRARRPGAAPPLDRGDRRARLRRQRARRARGRREPRGDVRGDRLGGAAAARRTSRATSWGSATQRGSCG